MKYLSIILFFLTIANATNKSNLESIKPDLLKEDIIEENYEEQLQVKLLNMEIILKNTMIENNFNLEIDKIKQNFDSIFDHFKPLLTPIILNLEAYYNTMLKIFIKFSQNYDCEVIKNFMQHFMQQSREFNTSFKEYYEEWKLLNC
jgi:hypothetical protein